MEQPNYRLAGWAALLSAVTFLISLGILTYHDIKYTPALSGGTGVTPALLLALGIDIISTILWIYAILKFRQLLGERYDFHAVDNIILVLIFGGVFLSALAHTGRMVIGDWSSVFTFAFFIAIAGIVLGVIGIVFALRLLKVPGSLNGYLKPLAYTELIGSICFAVVFLAPLGMIMMIVFNVILGLILLSRDASLEEVEFV
jgi:hypothetical protein